MQYRDSRDVLLSAQAKDSADRYDQLLELVARYDADPFSALEAALVADPEFVSAHCVRAGIGVMAAERGAEPLIRQSLEAAETLSLRANERELRHFAAAAAWLDGDFQRGADLYGRIALDYPRDLLALQVAHITDFYLGRQRLLRDRIGQALGQWNERLPGYGFVLGMLAFGLEETNLFDRAEEAGRRALDFERRDAWAVHAVTHVFEMTGQVETGIDWLETRRGDWAPNNAFAFHNFWHLALFRLERGDAAGALSLFDASIWSKPSSVALEMVDAASLLFRLHLRGVDLGGRAASVADAWSDRIYHGFYAFNDWHAVMAFIADGRLPETRRLVSELERRAGDDDSNAAMTREVGLPLARALLAFGEARYDEVVESLLPLRLRAHEFGGSNAQRDVIEQTLGEAAVRAGRTALAGSLISERRLLRPQNQWAREVERRLRLAEAQSAAGSSSAAE
jgi:tetratricopeptide (TPR) repeat protein